MQLRASLRWSLVLKWTTTTGNSNNRKAHGRIIWRENMRRKWPSPEQDHAISTISIWKRARPRLWLWCRMIRSIWNTRNKLKILKRNNIASPLIVIHLAWICKAFSCSLSKRSRHRWTWVFRRMKTHQSISRLWRRVVTFRKYRTVSINRSLRRVGRYMLIMYL